MLMKNKMLRVASVAVVMTLLSTCALSGTFARYSTTSNGEGDTAYVAKWGVTINNSGNAVFVSEKQDDEGNKVVSSSEHKVIAPGMSGALYMPTLSGTPEVAVSVTYAPELHLNGWGVAVGEESIAYCPIYFVVNGHTHRFGDGVSDTNTTYYTSVQGEGSLEEGVTNAISKDAGTTYAAGTDLSTKNEDGTNAVVQWYWDLDGNNDAYDTQLASYEGTEGANIVLTVTTTVTQIDDFNPAQNNE